MDPAVCGKRALASWLCRGSNMCTTARWWILGWAIALIGGGCGVGDESRDGREPARAGIADGWSKLTPPPISGRVDSLIAAVGDRIIVAGGWSWLCPPGADCVLPTAPPFADGAAYDLKSRQWTPIADAPVGFHSAPGLVVGDDIYALSQCDPAPSCPAGHALLRYRSKEDAWKLSAAPDAEGYFRLIRVGEGVVAYSPSDEGGSRPDYHFLPDEDRWLALPDDPLPPVYDRFVVEYDERLLVFGTPLASPAKTKLAAAYDLETGEWRELAESGTQGYQVWRAGSLLYLNPHFGSGGGGIYDPSRDVWRPLPDPPYHDMAGLIGAEAAIYEYASGWVLDARTDTWLSVEPRPDSSEVYGEVVGAGPDRTLLVFGGQTWSSGEGQLLNDTWSWTPPQ
jgi:hypothetical protein